MTDGHASARVARADAPVASKLRLPWGVCAVAHGDWVIFLDLARNRYQAASLTQAAGLISVPAHEATGGSEQNWQGLAQAGLVSRATRSEQPTPYRSDVRLTWRDLALLARACIWAGRIVKRGAILEAFYHLRRRKAGLPNGVGDLAEARPVYSRFAAARIWFPASYVCLFDSLALSRFLIGQGVCSDLVFGVRSRPFSAHCWVEVDGVVLDDGGEDCHSFAEIARV
ncbi:MAG: lasso peptide biosynthesis B2 protein [Hyphomonadaceae bacterium]